MKGRSLVEVWAQLLLSERDCYRIREFFASEFGIGAEHIPRNLHITVYHARTDMPGVSPVCEPAREFVDTIDTRFMVMIAGGEVAQPGVVPSTSHVGIRIRKQTSGYAAVQKYRQRLLKYETPEVLGGRGPSTANRSAFGAPHFQPHMVLLRPGSSVPDDLTQVGTRWREVMGRLTFDRFLVDISRLTLSRDRP